MAKQDKKKEEEKKKKKVRYYDPLLRRIGPGYTGEFSLMHSEPMNI